jgi:hypothetical protein
MADSSGGRNNITSFQVGNVFSKIFDIPPLLSRFIEWGRRRKQWCALKKPGRNTNIGEIPQAEGIVWG